MKAGALFGVLNPKQYVAVDISVDFLRQALAELQLHFPGLRMLGVGTDLSAGISLPSMVPREGRLFFYPGSSIGNFTPADALVFLSQIKEQCDRGGGLLIGVDLIKSATILNAAYDDPLGVTAAFNLNLLNNINGLIGSDFAVGDWRHRAFFNAALSRIEMHLEARREVTVKWPSGGRRFAEGERIHTENSYKYALADFRDLLVRAGFTRVQSWTDENDWFALFYAAV